MDSAIPRKDCPDCHGTGKIELLVSTVMCNCVRPSFHNGMTPEMIKDIDPNISRHASKELNDYINETLDVDIKWANDSCTCFISPPCGFCTRYADANLDEPEYCKACGDPSPTEQDLLHKCSKCGQLVCDLCLSTVSAPVIGPIEYLCRNCGE